MQRTSAVCYKEKVRTFLKAGILPLCGGIVVFILSYSSFQSHFVAMWGTIVGVLVVMLLLSLGIERADRQDASALTERLDYIKRIYETSRTAQDIDSEKRARRQAIREQLSRFLKRGEEIRKGIELNNTQSFSDKTTWTKEVSDYLKSWEVSAVHRFQNPNQATSQSSKRQHVEIADIKARLTVLRELITELQD